MDARGTSIRTERSTPLILGLLISAWDTDGSIIKGSDINGDGIVSAADLGLLIGAWGPCQ